MGTRLRLAVIADFVEEGWPSMDLCAEMLVAEAAKLDGIDPVLIRPRFRSRVGGIPGFRGRKSARRIDRAWNRFAGYKLALAKISNEFDAFHVVDHSYAHLVHGLPSRTGIYCHDLDAFRCILDDAESSSWFRRHLARKTLSGMQRGAVVFHSSQVVRNQIEAAHLVATEKLIQAPLGVCHEFVADVDEEPACATGRYVLHVGSCIPRKRIDILIRVFAALNAQLPELRLVQIGGDWTNEQRTLIRELGVELQIEQRRGINRNELASFYRQASLVLQTSEAEGFGIPLIEALSCGALVVASDLPVFREVAGDAAILCEVGDVDKWKQACLALLSRSSERPTFEERIARGREFSWARHAQTIVNAYRSLVAADPKTTNANRLSLDRT